MHLLSLVHKVSFLLVHVAFKSHGRRVQTSSDRLGDSPLVESQRLPGPWIPGHVSGSADALHPLRVLQRHLLPVNPIAALAYGGMPRNRQASKYSAHPLKKKKVPNSEWKPGRFGVSSKRAASRPVREDRPQEPQKIDWRAELDYRRAELKSRSAEEQEEFWEEVNNWGDMPKRKRKRPYNPPKLEDVLTKFEDDLLNNGVELNELQREALKVELAGSDTVVHAETGSGKTLCFVLPILAQLDPEAKSEGPQAIVVVPTLELAAQVARVFNILVPDSAFALERGMYDLPTAPVWVGPPKMLFDFLEDGTDEGLPPVLAEQEPGDVRFLVLDEADATLRPLNRYAPRDRKTNRQAHPKEAELLLERLTEIHGDLMQILAASATVGRPLKRTLQRLTNGRQFDLVRGDSAGFLLDESQATSKDDSRGNSKAERVITIPDRVNVSLVTTDEDNMLEAIRNILETEKPKAPLLFTQTDRSLFAEIQLLKSSKFNALSLNAAVMRNVQEDVPLAAPSADLETRSDGMPLLLVSTPGDTRGLDMHGLDLVIILGVPKADAFIHMAGRTGRQGKPGKVILLTSPKEADFKLGTLSAHMGLDFDAVHRHHKFRDEKLCEMWRVHSVRYQRQPDLGKSFLKNVDDIRGPVQTGPAPRNVDRMTTGIKRKGLSTKARRRFKGKARHLYQKQLEKAMAKEESETNMV